MELILFPSILASCSIFLLVFGISQLRQQAGMQDRLNTFLSNESFQQVTFQEIELSRPFSDRVIMPIVRRVASVFSWFWPERRLKAVQTRLFLAGSPGRLRAIDFLAVRAITGAVLLGMGLLYGYLTAYPVSFVSLLMLGALGFCGFYLPDFWLSRRITTRQNAVINSLPDALDMLTITIEAGLSFESGLQEIMNKWDNELSREFARTLRDIGMGQSRRQALNSLSERTGVSDVQSFVASLNQAEELGVSIGRVLKTQSEDMRVKRRQRAHERANQAPIKIMFPLVFLIFPAIFAVLLGPALPQLMAL